MQELMESQANHDRGICLLPVYGVDIAHHANGEIH